MNARARPSCVRKKKKKGKKLKNNRKGIPKNIEKLKLTGKPQLAFFKDLLRAQKTLRK